MSSLPWAYQHIRGKQAFNTQKLHEIYGPVVRISPSHLSFTEAVAWKDIYGHLIGHKSGQPEMSKTRAFASTLDDIPSSIINADRDEHGKLRRALARMFSFFPLQTRPTLLNNFFLFSQTDSPTLPFANKKLSLTDTSTSFSREFTKPVPRASPSTRKPGTTGRRLT